MTTKSKTKPVTKTATEKVAKPTIKSLQQEVANLKEQLDLANNLVNSLAQDLALAKSNAVDYKKQYLNEVSRISQLTSKVKDLENRSILAQILFTLSKPFK